MSDVGRMVPHNTDAEQSLLGACMLSMDAMSQAITIVDAGDFYAPGHGTLFAQMATMYRHGEPIDSVTVADALEREGLLEAAGGRVLLATIMAQTPATTAVAKYARIVVDHSTLRRLIAIGAELSQSAYEMDDPADAIDAVKAALAEIELPQAALPDGVWSVDSFLERPDDVQPPWVIPGLFRRGWRCVLVAEEGVGKTAIAHQLALASSQGIHPFALTEMPKIRTLLVDLENPDERIMSGFEMVTGPIRRDSYQRDQAWLWHQEGGIDIRKRADRGRLEAVIAATRPDLVCMGPIYKLYAYNPAKESDEQGARECMAVLDDLRTRYGFALFLEHHAPKKQAGYREMAPYGSSLWLRWPEFGLALSRDPNLNVGEENVHYRVGRFRHDRVKAAWPDGLQKATRGLPWGARWNDSMGMRDSAPAVLPQDDDDEEPF